MKVKGNTLKVLWAIVIGALVMVSCGGGEGGSTGGSPSSVVTAWCRAIVERNYKEALGYTDTRGEDCELLEAWMGMMFDEMGEVGMGVLSEEVSEGGEVATVKVKLERGCEVDTLWMETVRVGGEWRVRLVTN